MAAVLGRTQIQIKKTGVSTTVPDNPTARLMYYFDCICSCVEADNDPSIRRLRDFENRRTILSSEEEAQLLILCLALSPDKLIGSVLFPSEDISDGNEFYELSAVNTRLVVAQSLLIGGQQKRVKKIMMFKKVWIERNYLNPLLAFERGLTRPRALPSPSARPQLASPAPRRPPVARPVTTSRPSSTKPPAARSLATSPPAARPPAARPPAIRPPAARPPATRATPPSYARPKQRKRSCTIM